MALLLFGVFAVCILAVLLTGADAYRRLTQRDRAAYERRTCVQYVATRVRQSDRLDGVRLEEFNGTDCLVLDAEEEYVTRIYCHDGWIMELYCAAGLEMDPEDGEPVMAAEGLGFTLEDGLLTITATDSQGTEQTLLLSLRGGEGETP